MRKYTIAAALVFMLAGCVQVGGKDFPQATAGFTPKTVYTASVDRAWAATITTLNANSIGVVSTSKETGQITTDYVTGPDELIGLGIISGNHTRYRYTIFISPRGNGHTAINISPVLEVSQTAQNGTTPFHDVSANNAETVAKLRMWLYEQIEHSLS